MGKKQKGMVAIVKCTIEKLGPSYADWHRQHPWSNTVELVKRYWNKWHLNNKSKPEEDDRSSFRRSSAMRTPRGSHRPSMNRSQTLRVSVQKIHDGKVVPKSPRFSRSFSRSPRSVRQSKLSLPGDRSFGSGWTTPRSSPQNSARTSASPSRFGKTKLLVPSSPKGWSTRSSSDTSSVESPESPVARPQRSSKNLLDVNRQNTSGKRVWRPKRHRLSECMTQLSVNTPARESMEG